MKNYKIIIESYFFNNSDFKEYDSYFLESESLESAKSYAKKVLEHWATKNKGVSYYLYNIEEL